jgi:inosine-uridine nucleoside N-ribohydrolase
MTFPTISDGELIRRLRPPAGPVSAVLDTDAYNEIDDQFALVYSLLSESIDLQAVYAAPFHNSRSSGPGDGMEKSYEEILRVLERLGRSPEGLVFKGSHDFMRGIKRPIVSPAVQNLIARAEAMPEGQALYVLAIGAITNVASALLTRPSLVERIAVVWLGGQPHSWHTADEFNLRQDVAAAQVVFDSGVPLVHLPCSNVAEHIRTTVPEVRRHLAGTTPIGDYLVEIFEDFMGENTWARSKVIWDVITVAWLLNADWVPTRLAPSPILTERITWSADPSRHFIREGIGAHRDAIFADLFRKVREAGQ